MFPQRKKNFFPLFLFAVLTNQFGNNTWVISSDFDFFPPSIHEWIRKRTRLPLHFLHIKNFLPILWKVRAIIQKRCSLYSQHWIRSYSYHTHIWCHPLIYIYELWKNMNGTLWVKIRGSAILGYISVFGYFSNEAALKGPEGACGLKKKYQKCWFLPQTHYIFPFLAHCEW